MMTNQQDNPVDNFLKNLSCLISIICFSIGFWQTAKGLQTLFPADQAFFAGYIISAFILLGLVFFYVIAIHKDYLWAFMLYIAFASINFVCNINAFYPNFMVDTLVRNEIDAHKLNYEKLSNDIHSAFLEPNLTNLENDINARIAELNSQASAEQDGFGRKSQQILDGINGLLKTSILAPTIKHSDTNQEKNRKKDELVNVIRQALKAAMSKDSQKDKIEFINNVVSDRDRIFPQFNGFLPKQPEKLKYPVKQEISFLIQEAVDSYSKHCNKAHTLNTPSKTVECNENYYSENRDLGKFSHTFPSLWKHINEANAIIVIILCFLIDFITPLSAYWYLKSHQQDHNFKKPFHLPWQDKDVGKL